jgi:hypothetical protein
MVLEITSQDKVIDPACGTGGFVIEALRQVQERERRPTRARRPDPDAASPTAMQAQTPRFTGNPSRSQSAISKPKHAAL